MRNLFTSIALMLSLLATAQTPQPAQPRVFTERTVIDSVTLIIDYRVKLRTFVGKDFFRSDLQTLEIGSKYSRFYSKYAERVDSISTYEGSMVRLGKDEEGNTREGFYEELYWNYPSSGSLSVTSRYLKRDFIYDETIPKMDWTIIHDSTEVILGYECMLAKCSFRGREWKVWFSPDIPSSLGPWKLNGLPGLILKAEDSDQCFYYEAAAMHKKSNGSMHIYDSQLEKCSREDVFHMNELRWKDYSFLIQMMSGKQMITMTQDDHGGAVTADNASKQVIPQKETE